MPSSRSQDDLLLKETRHPGAEWITKAPRPGALTETYAVAPWITKASTGGSLVGRR